MPLEHRVAQLRHSEEVQHPVVDLLGLGEEAVAVEDQDPLPAEQRLQPVELLGVAAPGQVGVVPVGVVRASAAPRRRPLLGPGEPPGLQLQRALEVRLGLEASGQLVGVRGVGPLDRVAHQHDQLHPGQVAAIRSPASGWNR